MKAKRFFDARRPLVLLHWRDVHAVSRRESRELLALGARWLPLAHAPYDMTLRGTKRTEIRNADRNRKDYWREGGLVVLGRGYNGDRAAATVDEIVRAVDLASVDPRELAGVGWNAQLHGAPVCAAPMCTTVDDAYWQCYHCHESGALPTVETRARRKMHSSPRIA